MIKSKVRKMGNDRKVIEVPYSVRDGFEEGEVVEIKKVKQ